MTRNIRVLCDVDGVLCNYSGGALSVIQEITGRPPPEDILNEWDIFRQFGTEERKEIFKAFEKEGWCYSLEVLPGALQGIRNLRKAGADIYFVTAPWHSPHWTYERTKWLCDYFEADKKHIVHAHAKYLCVGDVFIDDKISHVQTWQDHHPLGVGILWEAPYNRSIPYPIRSSSWDFVLSVVTR